MRYVYCDLTIHAPVPLTMSYGQKHKLLCRYPWDDLGNRVQPGSVAYMTEVIIWDHDHS